MMKPVCGVCGNEKVRRLDDANRRVWACEYCEYRALANAIMQKEGCIADTAYRRRHYQGRKEG